MDVLKQITLWLASGTEAAAAIVIAAAAIEATLASLALFVRRTPAPGSTSRDAKEEIRLRLGRWLALSLEFALAADILRTAVAPTWDEIGKLAAIAVLRTALNFFLQREIDSAQARHRNPVAATSAPKPEDGVSDEG